MGKKLNTNPKAAAANERKDSAKSAAKSKASADEEDGFWKEASKGQGEEKRNKKKEAAIGNKADSDAKKAEAKKMAADEALEMSTYGKKEAKKKKAPKTTLFEVTKKKEKIKAQDKKKAAEDTSVVSESEYAQMVEVDNKNATTDIDAQSVEAALAALSVDEPPADKHPEKRRRALHQAFEERELPGMRQDYPNLKLSQYKEKIFEMWKKSPENPSNFPVET